MTKFKVLGLDREVGAIGIFEPFTIVVTAVDEIAAEDKARKARYADGREHVQIHSIVEGT